MQHAGTDFVQRFVVNLFDTQESNILPRDSVELGHETVTRTTGELQRTHVALQGQVRRLQGELAEANAQLRRSKALAALGEVAAGIAHEVRNPLGSIRLYAQMLAEDVGDRPPALDLCDKIGRAVTGLDAIVRDVLLFAGEIHLHAAPEPAGPGSIGLQNHGHAVEYRNIWIVELTE